MKEYRFDYLKEQVEKWKKWNPGVPITLEWIESFPFLITLPWIMPGEYRPATDYYGDVVEDFGDWYRQRHEYCLKLAKEYETLQDKGR